MGQLAAQLGLHSGRNPFIVGGQQLKSERLQRIASQQSLGLAKLHVHGGLATAQHIVVHAWHVVVHQRIRVNQFHSARRAQSGFISTAALRHIQCGRLGAEGRLVSRQNEQGAQALATIQNCVAHGIAQTCRGLNAHPAGQRVFHTAQVVLAPPVQIPSGQRCRSHGGTHSCPHACRLPSSTDCLRPIP